MNYKLKVIFVLSFSLISFKGYGQLLKEGIWKGNIHYSQQVVPFTFNIESSIDGNPIITLINADERLVINNIYYTGDSLVIPMHVFDASIQARVKGSKMKGYWIKIDSIPFTAKFNAPRFKTSKSKDIIKLPDKLSMQFIPPGGIDYPGLGLFKQEGGKVSGTILTEVGDYRYFEGVIRGNILSMSSFDGVHAFMITGEWKDGQWSGKYHFDENYVEDWESLPGVESGVRDPFEIVELEKGTHRIYFDILAPASGRNVIDPAKYEGKVLLIQIFGTWCPNSFDQTKFLVPWFEQNQSRGVELLAVSYEVNYSKEYGLRRIEEYKSKMGIDYEVLLGGRVNKEQAAMAFPFMKKLEAFPTLVILDKSGYARYVNSYFTGPATGEYYIKFQERFNSIINQLLEE